MSMEKVQWIPQDVKSVDDGFPPLLHLNLLSTKIVENVSTSENKNEGKMLKQKSKKSS